MKPNNTTPTNRQVRIFVSSTFRDMKAERDYLVKFTFPELRALCESRGVTWGDVDLRWGVADEQKAEGKVLPICLDEIQRCRPFFIGLLGERYGWIPEEIPKELIEREPWIEPRQGRSVTEFEIVHGVLNQAEILFRHLSECKEACLKVDEAVEIQRRTGIKPDWLQRCLDLQRVVRA
jgi:hypothetical protein